MSLSHTTKKRKLVIIENVGSIKFLYHIDPLKLECQCNYKYSPGKSICRHLKYYLCEQLGLHECYVPILSVPRIRSKIAEICDNHKQLNRYCLKFLTNEEEDYCLICHEAYLTVRNGALPNPKNILYQCPKCFELLHNKCYQQWKCKGGTCPRCKYCHDLNGGVDEVKWLVTS